MCLSKKEHEALLFRMEKDNRNLKNLTRDSLDLEPMRTSRRKGQDPFHRIRDCARSLHSALRMGLSCTCTSHSADLKLEIRDCDDTPSFRVLFPTTSSLLAHDESSAWQEAEFRPLDNGERQPLRQRPKNVDSALCAGEFLLGPKVSRTHMAILSPTMRFGIGVPALAAGNTPLPSRSKYTALKNKVGWVSTISSRRDRGRMDVRASGSVVSSDLPAAISLQAIDNTLMEITNLCQALNQTHIAEQNEVCLGRLHDGSQFLGVYVNQPYASSLCNKATSLHDILRHDPTITQQDPRPHTIQGNNLGVSMTKKQRLRTAVTLASSTLQLQTTDWLNSKWGKEDILFHHDYMEQPYISKIFREAHVGDQVPGNTNDITYCGPIRNESIFNLGVLLLELSYGKPLDHFKSPDDPPVFTDFVIARRLIEDLAEEESSGYVDAARACIFCDFGTKVKIPSLDDKAFRQAVYQDVVLPLEDEWRHWNGQWS